MTVNLPVIYESVVWRMFEHRYSRRCFCRDDFQLNDPALPLSRYDGVECSPGIAGRGKEGIRLRHTSHHSLRYVLNTPSHQ